MEALLEGQRDVHGAEAGPSPCCHTRSVLGGPGPPREERILNFYKKTDLQLGEGMNLIGKRGKC